MLTPNKKFEGNTVTKIALLDKETSDIIYIEDEIISKDIYDKLWKQAVCLKLTEKDSKIYDKLSSLEQWYIPYLSSEKILEPSQESKINKAEQKLYSDIQEQKKEDSANKLQISRNSAMPNIPYSDSISSSIFTTLGKEYLVKDSNIYFGYFKNSYEWPLNSGNIITNFIQWEYQEDYPRSSSQDEVYLNVEVITSNSYLYTKSTNSTCLWDDHSYLQLDNISIGMSSNDKSDEFFYMRKFYGETGGTTYHPIKAFLGGCPYVSNFYWAWSELVNDKSQSLNGTDETWPSSRSQQEASGIFGNNGVNRAIAGECTEYLRNENQHFKIEGKLEDCGTSSKKLYYHPKFSVYSRDGWTNYSVNEVTINFNYYISYYR